MKLQPHQQTAIIGAVAVLCASVTTGVMHTVFTLTAVALAGLAVVMYFTRGMHGNG